MTTQSFKIKGNRKAEASIDVTFGLIDGPQYTWMPGDLLHKLGIEPYREMVFKTWQADEEDEIDGGHTTQVHRKVGEAYFELNGVGAMSPVVFGEENDENAIGACTITALGFQLDSSMVLVTAEPILV